MSSQEGLSILEALDNLNALVEVDSLDEIEITADDHIISHKEEKEGTLKTKEVYWLHAGADDQTMHAIKTTFGTVYRYLQGFYQTMQTSSNPKKALEGINTIMVLVGEAARKLDKYSSVFQHRIYDLEEYRKLQGFFKKQVVEGSYKEFAAQALPEREEAEALEEVDEEIYLLNSLEVVKGDKDYELFYLRKEDGRPFYTYDLARKIKLDCDFGQFAEEYFGDDPLLQIKNWEDKSVQVLADKIYTSAKKGIRDFYKEAMQYKGMDLVNALHNALMALMLAKNPRNLIRQFALKGCHAYFNNFQSYLREALNSREYQKFLAYAPPASQSFFLKVLDLVHTLSYALFTFGPWQKEVQEALVALNHRETKGKEEKHQLSLFLSGRYKVLKEALKRHPNGPVFKAFDLIIEEEEPLFDPYMQGNLPTQEFALLQGEKESLVLRMGAPVIQEFINKATITPEFVAYLRSLVGKRKLCLFDYQDITSWKDHARAQALAHLTRQAEFADTLTVVTLAKETDFYHQTGHYADLNEASDFKESFYAHLSDERTGYFFPRKVRLVLFPKWVKELLEEVHTAFFKGKKQLSHRERELFIELSYVLIELKVMEHIEPDLIGHVSKDGLDLGSTASLALMAVFALHQKHTFSTGELNHLNYVLFGPTLVLRERAIENNAFHRLYTLIEFLEKEQPIGKGRLLDPLQGLFKSDTLKGKVRFFKES